MATSPIYSWPEPDNTDLVRNGALAIRTLGNAIDTTMGTMTPKSIVDAKGDLIAATANDTPARLAVGANGTQLVADSTQTTGLGWVATPAASNPVINSGYNVWQRGTSISYNNESKYSADRWQASIPQVGTISRQATADTTNLPFIQYCARIQRTAGNTGTSEMQFTQTVESVNSIPIAGKTITFSFYARKGANYSATSDLLNYRFVLGTGTDQNLLTGFTGQGNAILANATLTTTWQRFTATVAMSSATTQIGINFVYTPTGTAGANDYYEVTGVQVDIGSVALPFRTAGVSYQQELALCQRYYYRSTGGATYSTYGAGYATLTTEAVYAIKLPVTMRVKPTALDYGNLGADFYNASNTTFTSLVLNASGSGVDWARVVGTVASGLTQYRAYDITNANNAAGFIGFSAEL
jgi:hypothetical protein